MPSPSPASTLAELQDWTIEVRCHCGRSAGLPCRLLARRYGPDTPVAVIAARLLCERCRTRPESIDLVDHPQHDAPGYYTRSGEPARATRIPLTR
jgi:hypothetical protein